MNILEKIKYLNKKSKYNWEIRFHGKYVDINFPDAPYSPDYEDYTSLSKALNAVIKDYKYENR